MTEAIVEVVPVDISMTERDLGPYCPMYVDDILGGTQLYGASLFGAYHLLLYHQWKYGYVPRDLTACQTIARCDQATVERILTPEAPERPKFTLHPCGGLVNPRMAAVRHDRAEFIREQRRKSALAVKARADVPRGTIKPSGQPAGKPVDQPADEPAGKPGGSSGRVSPPSSSSSSILSIDSSISLSLNPEQLRASQGGDVPEDLKGQVAAVKGARPEFHRLNELAIVAELKAADPDHVRECVRRFVADSSNQESVKNPIGMLRAYMRPPKLQPGEDQAARDRKILKGSRQ